MNRFEGGGEVSDSRGGGEVSDSRGGIFPQGV